MTASTFAPIMAALTSGRDVDEEALDRIDDVVHRQVALAIRAATETAAAPAISVCAAMNGTVVDLLDDAAQTLADVGIADVETITSINNAIIGGTQRRLAEYLAGRP